MLITGRQQVTFKPFMEDLYREDVQAHPEKGMLERLVSELKKRFTTSTYNLFFPMGGAHQPITFTNENLRGFHFSHDDALVILATIVNFNIQRILVDNGSFVDILFILAFDKMKICRDRLHPFHTPLVGFGGSAVSTLGWIKLPLT